jgi:hypothetical protein
LAKRVAFMKLIVRWVFVVASKNLVSSGLLTSCHNGAYAVQAES